MNDDQFSLLYIVMEAMINGQVCKQPEYRRQYTVIKAVIRFPCCQSHLQQYGVTVLMCH